MKIKKLPNTKKVIVEFDEFHIDADLMPESIAHIDCTIEKMNELSPRRTAYNMWEFKSEEDALQAIFLLGLKQ